MSLFLLALAGHAANLPAAFDAEEQWPQTKTPVLNQAQCGSCWSFSTTQQLAARILVLGGPAGSALSQDGSVISAETPVAFFSQLSGEAHGCNGGDPLASIQVISTRGVPVATCAKYISGMCDEGRDASQDGCTDGQGLAWGTCYSDPSQKWDSWGHMQGSLITSAQYINGSEAMMADLFANGPVATEFTVYQNFMDQYNACSQLGSCPVYAGTSGAKLGGHAVLIVGWGDDGGTPYWRIRNSWGDSWGDAGYFRILRGSNLAGVEAAAVAFQMAGSAAGAPKTGGEARARPEAAPLLPGGWLEQRLDSALIKKAAAAAEAQAAAQPEANPIGRLLKRAFSQVVAGLNVRLVYAPADAGDSGGEETTLLVHKAAEEHAEFALRAK